MEMLRAVIYSRCSTEEESQADALKKQEAESIACVRNQGWYLVDKYVEAKSGTSAVGRDEYQRLYDDLQTNKFDVIVIKSQDRLMRNVKDWYLFIDRLITNGKRLYIYIESKFYSSDDSLITGIKAILAEDYSRELSKKMNNAHRNRQKNGGKSMLTSRTFGYQKCADGKTEVIEEEVEIVRQVYSLCIAGYGSRTISNILMNQGFKNRNGNHLSANRVLKMIRNPLYTGTMVMNRKHYEFDAKKVIQNPPEEWIYQEGAVPAIIDKETWQKANEQIDKRAKKHNQPTTYHAWSNPGKFQLSGKLVCADCSKKYYRTFRKSYANPDETVVEWKCSTYMTKGRKNINRRDKLRNVTKDFYDGCDNTHLEEQIVFSLLEQICNQYLELTSQKKKKIIDRTIQLLQKALRRNDVGNELHRLGGEEKRLLRQKDMLLSKLLDSVISDSDYQRKNGEIETRIATINSRREELKQSEWEMKNLEQRIDRIKSNLENGGIEKATVGRMLEDIEEIIVHEWHLVIRFNPLKLMGLTDHNPLNAGLCYDSENDDFTILVDYPFPSTTEKGRFIDRISIVELMEQTPAVTAKKIAVQISRPLYTVQKRIAELRKDGCIKYAGVGGRGTWEVLKSSELIRAQRRK